MIAEAGTRCISFSLDTGPAEVNNVLIYVFSFPINNTKHIPTSRPQSDVMSNQDTPF